MVMELKEIKTRYKAKCAKCDGEIKVGWTAFYNPVGKIVYCKPCGQVISQKDSVIDPELDESKKKLREKEKPFELLKLLAEISADLGLVIDTTASLHEQNLKILAALIVKTETKKETVKNAK